MLGLLKQIKRKQPQFDIEPGETSIFSLRKKLNLIHDISAFAQITIGGDK